MGQRCRGFTLLELMIVIVLVGVLLGMVSFAVGPNPARQARQDAQGMAGLIQQLRERAVLDGEEFGLRLSDGGYRALRLAAHRWEPVSVLYTWPVNVQLHLEQDGYPLILGSDEGPPQVLMLSNDEISAFTLTFSTPERTLLSLSSDGFGEVVIDG
ncbi:type II secretion system minor pseudopilin GspH [Pseudomonas sp. GB2N2]